MASLRHSTMRLSVLAMLAIAQPAAGTGSAASPRVSPPVIAGPRAVSVEIGGWTKVDIDGDAQVFYRSQRGGARGEWPRADIRVERETPDPAYPHFLSKLSRLEFNCGARTRRVVLSTLYTGSRQSGRAFIGARGSWAAVMPGTAEAVVLAQVCVRN